MRVVPLEGAVWVDVRMRSVLYYFHIDSASLKTFRVLIRCDALLFTGYYNNASSVFNVDRLIFFTQLQQIIDALFSAHNICINVSNHSFYYVTRDSSTVTVKVRNIVFYQQDSLSDCIIIIIKLQ